MLGIAKPELNVPDPRRLRFAQSNGIHCLLNFDAYDGLCDLGELERRCARTGTDVGDPLVCKVEGDRSATVTCATSKSAAVPNWERLPFDKVDAPHTPCT
jgi:hypothetical protein